ncbi:MAG: phosphoadenosine phosphosulfate reductase, partial [Bacteroidales bacterium]|nr:phosphoadenosine phosphosulfate reductase [Bacteroidales bacterium]
INRKGNIVPIYPFIDDGIVLEDVIHILNDSGLGLPKYYKWRKRSGCFFCFYQKENEWRGLKKYHPHKFAKACQYEENHSDGRVYTWRGKKNNESFFLRELGEYVPTMEEKCNIGNVDKKLSNILDVNGLMS